MNTTLTLAGKRVDARRRTLLLGAAGASLAQLSGCGGGNGSSMMGQNGNAPLVDPAAGAAAERSLPIVQQDTGIVDGSGGRQFSLTVGRGSSQLLSNRLPSQAP